MRKKRIEKKAEKLRRKKVHEILEMVLEVNTTYPRDREFTGALPTVFFKFSGHISEVYVQVCRDGWDDKDVHCGFTDWLEARVELNKMEELKGKVEKIQEELRHAGKM